MVTIGTPAGQGSVIDPRSGLLDPSTAPISYGYYAENATGAEEIARHLRSDRDKTIGWWNRHRILRLGIGATLVLNLGVMPSVQDAVLSFLQHL
ncbi:hypothetical protein [Nocardia sp. NPDC051570]|uniref:hypothetical protein n=1 Tax=Nocardia sp. NPDC051570 TaxID=3364324 RepID=UPI0037AE5670